MGKRNQFNGHVLSSHTTFTKAATATDISFAGPLSLPATSSLVTAAVVADDIVGPIPQNGASVGRVILTNVTLAPQRQFQVRITNTDIPADEGWLAFTQVSGPTGSYSNLAAVPNGANLRIRVASQTDNLVNDRVEISYFLIRSLDG